MASGIEVISRTTTSITFSLTLSKAFTASNYIRVGVCNFTFTNDTPYFIENESFNRLAWSSTDFNGSTEVELTVGGLKAGTEYTFYGFAQANNGNYYCIPYPQEAIVVSTKSGPSTSGLPEDLICRKRYSYQEDTSCTLDFEVTVPANSGMLWFQLAKDTDFGEIVSEFRANVADAEALNHVSGCTYSFVTYAPCAATYYARARYASSEGTVYSDWCSTVRISTPPSNAVFSSDLDIPQFRYAEATNRMQLFMYNDVMAYDFTRAVFTIYKDGIPASITHTRKGSVFTEVSGKTSYTEYRSDFSTNGSTGVAIYYPEAGTYLGVIRVYYDIGNYALQPVDKDGNEICFMSTITIEGSIEPEPERPDYFDWDNAKTSGGEYNLTAKEWNRLTENINTLLRYKEKDAHSFTEAIKDTTTVTASIYNEVCNALLKLGISVDTANAGDVLYAKLLNDIKGAVNSIE